MQVIILKIYKARTTTSRYKQIMLDKTASTHTCISLSDNNLLRGKADGWHSGSLQLLLLHLLLVPLLLLLLSNSPSGSNMHFSSMKFWFISSPFLKNTCNVKQSIQTLKIVLLITHEDVKISKSLNHKRTTRTLLYMYIQTNKQTKNG